MPAASSDLRKELNGAEEDGPEHDARIFGEVTDLFLSNVGRLGDSQIAAVDGVLSPSSTFSVISSRHTTIRWPQE